MTIKIKESGRSFEVRLQRWNGGWEPDCFHDMETNFPREHESEDGSILATESEFEDLIDWWDTETDNANDGIDGDGLLGLTEAEREQGIEWCLFVKELED